jgi:undecaprenyl-diphosphatase
VNGSLRPAPIASVPGAAPWPSLAKPILTAGWIAIAAVLTVLAVEAHRFASFPLDRSMTTWTLGFEQMPLTPGEKLIGDVAGPLGASIEYLMVLGAFLILRLFREALCAAVAGLGAEIGNIVINGLVARPRPPAYHGSTVLNLGAHSFPSGHTADALGLFGFLFYLCAIVAAASPTWRGWLRAAQVVIVLYLADVGVSRVLEQQHWPSDVFAGYLVGALALIPAIALYHRLGERAASENQARGRVRMATVDHTAAQADQHGEQEPSGGETVHDAVHDAVHDVREQAAEERQPRWQALRRGHTVLVAYSVVILITAALALAAHSVAVLPGDLPFTRELQESTLPGLAGLMQFITFLGNPSQAVIVDVLAIGVLLVLGMPLEAGFAALTGLADAVGGLLKLVVGRHRPASDLVHVFQIIKTPSFPSGHTLHFTVFYGFLIFVIATNYKRSWQRNALIVALAIPVGLVGLSRIYLGEHWLSDVIGGYLVGALCLVPLIAGYLWTRERYVVTGRPPFVQRRISTAE